MTLMVTSNCPKSLHCDFSEIEYKHILAGVGCGMFDGRSVRVHYPPHNRNRQLWVYIRAYAGAKHWLNIVASNKAGPLHNTRDAP
jgi:hypothetical protein